MNALPLNNPKNPKEIIDELVASVGLRRVLLAVLTQVFRRTRPPDSASFPTLHKQPGLESLSDHLRKDLGLPPDTGRTTIIDPITIKRTELF